MTQADVYATARRRAEAKYSFYVHVAVYIAVMLLLLVIDLLTSPETTWFVWPLMGWGIGVALHGASVFLLSGRNTIVDTLTERELRHAGAHKHL